MSPRPPEVGVPQWRSQTDKQTDKLHDRIGSEGQCSENGKLNNCNVKTQTSRNKTNFFLSFNIYINKRNDCILQKNILIPSCNGVMETFNLKTHKKRCKLCASSYFDW